MFSLGCWSFITRWVFGGTLICYSTAHAAQYAALLAPYGYDLRAFFSLFGDRVSAIPIISKYQIFLLSIRESIGIV